MDDKQIRLISWMYNFCITEMKMNPDKFFESDIEKLTDAMKRRFPENADNIVTEFK